MPRTDVLFREIGAMAFAQEAPAGFITAIKVRRTELGRAWLVRQEIEEDAVLRGGWNVFLLSLAIVIATSIVLIAAGLSPLLVIIPVALVPLIASSLYLNAPEGFAMAEERSMLRDAPATIGRITMSMQVVPSLERAVGFAARREGSALSRRLNEAVWSSLTRAKGSVSEAVLDLSASLSEGNASLRQALHLVISSTGERTREGMYRLLDKANTVALVGVRDAVDRYVSSLSLPSMVLFSLGTLLPIMLFSLMPLLSIGTSFGQEQPAAIPFPYLAFLLLVLLPGAAMAYSWVVLSRNPLGMAQEKEDAIEVRKHLPFVAAWIIAILIVSLFDLGDVRSYALAGTAVVAPCAYVGWKLRGKGVDRKRRASIEADAIGALFQIGNRMVSGASLESALENVARTKKGPFSDTIKMLLHRSRTTGKGLDIVIVEDGTLRSVSVLLENAFVTIAECSVRDPRYSGQVALYLAQMLTDLDACQTKVEERLRGVVDMMRSTSMIFAPIVLGVTGALFALIDGRAASGTTASDVALITGLYIGELSLLVSFFTVLVMGEKSWRGVAYQYAVRTPIAFIVFVAVSIICRTGLNGLL